MQNICTKVLVYAYYIAHENIISIVNKAVDVTLV